MKLSENLKYEKPKNSAKVRKIKTVCNLDKKEIGMRLVILCLLATFFSTGCTTTKAAKDSIADNPSCRTLPTSPIPGWITGSPSGNIEAYYGVGVSEELDMSFTEMKSISRMNANTELAHSLEVRIQSGLRQEVTSTSGNDYEKKIKVIIKSNSDLLVSGSKVDSVWLNRETCQLWTRVKLSKTEAERSRKEMKSLVMRELERAAKNVASIKDTIESDPNVILRKYGLSISNPYYDYMRALNLGIEKEEIFKILDLYYQFGHIPSSVYDYKKITNTSGAIFYTGKIRTSKMPTILYTTLIDENKRNQSSLLLDYMSIKSIQDVGIDVMRMDLEEKNQQKHQEKIELENSKLRLEREATNEKIASYEKSMKEKIDDIPEVSAYHTENSKCFDVLRNSGSSSFLRCMEKEERERKINYKKYKFKVDTIKKATKAGVNEIKRGYSPSAEKIRTQYVRVPITEKIYLHHAVACWGSPEGMMLLEKSGFSINKKTSRGLTAKEFSKACDNQSVYEIL
jgi:hypothetical protein